MKREHLNGGAGKIEVLKSKAGYYIGTLDREFGGPYSRNSNYYRTEEEARQALLDYRKNNLLCLFNPDTFFIF